VKDRITNTKQPNINIYLYINLKLKQQSYIKAQDEMEK